MWEIDKSLTMVPLQWDEQGYYNESVIPTRFQRCLLRHTIHLKTQLRTTHSDSKTPTNLAHAQPEHREGPECSVV